MERLGIYAHTHPLHPNDPSRWEPLFDGLGTGHLEKVAALATRFASEMFPVYHPLHRFCIALIHNASMWHDLGKYSVEFQTYLRSAAGGNDQHHAETLGRVDHSTAGAKHAVEAIPNWGFLIAYAIAGHHSGLPDGYTEQPSCLKSRLTKQIPSTANAPVEVLAGSSLVPPAKLPPRDAYSYLCRFLFSCLVDADFLATEAFMAPGKACERPGSCATISQLDAHFSAWLSTRFSAPETPIQIQRDNIRQSCLAAAEKAPGFFSLTVPTGGGKTLSSLAFALRHARLHDLRRVIYAIPFTSIIEQNAKVFRDIFETLDAEAILEHHSNFDIDRETTTSRLACENWDAPIVVTTNVQLFESLFASKTSRCRKLHRIARSVIILDEVQTLPVTLLKPCLMALKELVDRYGCTVVLCTATQPALQKRPDFQCGLEIPPEREIAPNPQALYQALKRVEVVDAGTLSLDALTSRLAKEPRVLCIVSTKRHAKDIFDRLRGQGSSEGLYHLSAAMCPEHRSHVLASVRRRLDHGQECRVVATQLVEAGVDIDFPVVYRCIAGLDSIAQAAGRCNREGKLPRAGKTYVFRPDSAEHSIPKGMLGQSASAAEEIIPLYASDPLSLPAIEHYFRLHYWKHQDRLDKENVLGCFAVGTKENFPFRFQFAEAASKFRFIESAELPVIIPLDDTARGLVEQVKARSQVGVPPSRYEARKLQRYTVTIPESRWREALASGLLELVCDRFPVLVSPALHYCFNTGLRLPGASGDDIESLIVG